MKIALTNLDQIWESPQENFELCEKIAIEAVKCGCKLIIFPEMTLTGFTSKFKEFSEDIENSNSISRFQDLAKRLQINIVFGALLKSDNKYRNTAITIASSGDLVGVYSKIHPFSFSGESEHIESGDTPVIVNVEDFKIGLTICYDLRFSHLYNYYANTCDLVINIANWPKKRIIHWGILLRARAIENQYFVAGVNRSGVDGNSIEYEKSSFLTSPQGDIMKSSNSSEGIDVYDISPQEVSRQRKTFPILHDRRIELYREWLS
jgi:omega-amidase